MQVYNSVDVGSGYSIKVLQNSDNLDSVLRLMVENYQLGPYYKDGDTVPLQDFINTISEYTEAKLTDKVCLVLWKDGEAVGYLAGLVSTHPIFVLNKTAIEAVWFISPEHRGKQSLKLIKAYEEWARAVGCTRVSVGCYQHDSDMADKIDRVYTRMGYSHMELLYIKEIK